MAPTFTLALPALGRAIVHDPQAAQECCGCGRSLFAFIVPVDSSLFQLHSPTEKPRVCVRQAPRRTRRRRTQSLADFFLSKDLWICGITPPPAMVALISVSSSSSPRMASCRWRGVIRFTRRSLEALPASSSTSAVRYSRMAAEYTAAVAPTRPLLVTRILRWRWIRPTGNCRPALDDRDTDFLAFSLAASPLTLEDIVLPRLF